MTDWTWKRGPGCIGDPGSHYNGWSWDQRCQITQVQNAAIRAGSITQPTVCGITGHTGGYVYMHTEDYGLPLAFYPIARFAHALLHQRFTDPLPWNRLVKKHYVHGAWFTFLTMDPNDMQRAFAQVYPQGLPADGEVWPTLADAIGLTPAHFAVSVAEAARSGLFAGNPWRDPVEGRLFLSSGPGADETGSLF